MRIFANRRSLVALCATLLVAAGCDDKDLTSPAPDLINTPTAAFATLVSVTAPTLPKTVVDTRLIAPTGKTIAVPAGGSFQQALDQAQPGDVITLQAGATYTGNFILRAKTGTGWITIKSSSTAIPSPGTRVTPANAGAMPKIVSPNVSPAIQTALGAHHYRLIGLEIAASGSLTTNYGLVQLGTSSQTAAQVPTNIILDRLYVHGHSNLHLKRCVELNSASSAVIDSYLSECHGKGQDTQAILGWNGPGPFKIENNYLEGAGENVMFGGADPSISGLVPSDIEIRRNHFFKPPSWKGVWTVKNLFELKSAQRVLIEGNVMENNWVDGQVGFAILLKSVNPGGKCTWCITQDITFRYNRIRNSANGVNIIATPQGTVAGPVRRVQFRHNIIENIDVGPIYYGTGRLFQLLEEITDLSIEHNTTFSNGGDQLISFGSMPVLVRLAFRDNVANRGRYGIKGGGVGEGTPSLNTYAPTYDVRGNVIIGAAASSYPTSNYFPSTVTATGFVGYSTGNYRLTSSSAYSGMATDGSDPGADIAGVESATANVTSGTGGGTIPAGSPSSPTPTLPPPDTTTAPAPSPTPTPSSLYTVSVPSTTIAVGTTVVGTASLPTGVRRVRWAVSQWKPLTLSGVGAPKSEQMGIVGLAAGGDWVRVRWLDDNDVVLHADSIWMTVGSSTTTSPT